MQLEAQQRILGYFIEEARDHLRTLEQSLMVLHTPDPDGERMNELFRAAHSLKGGAAMLGLQAIRTIAHRLEDNFKVLQLRPEAVGPELEHNLLRTVDILQGLLAQIQSPGTSEEETESKALAVAEPLLQEIERLLNSGQVPATAQPPGAASALADLFAEVPPELIPVSLPGAGVPDTEADMLSMLFGSEVELERLTAQPVDTDEPETPAWTQVDLGELFAPLSLDELPAFEVPPEEPVVVMSQSTRFTAAPAAFEELEAAGSRQTAADRRTMRVEVRLLDGLNNMVGELLINRNSLEVQHDRLRQFLETLQTRAQQLNRVSQTLAEYYDRTALGSSGTPAPAGHGNSYDDSSFDALEMDRYTGFHTISQEIMELIVRVREVVSDLEFVSDETEISTRQLRYVSSQLQEGLNIIRLLPLTEIADRLPRAVRDLSASLGKEVDLRIEGRDLLLDKAILEALYDPLTHLITNALIHGVEAPEERVHLGKPARGQIVVRAFPQGNQTLLSISDDGRGLDLDRIRSTAIARGIVTAEGAYQMSDAELCQLIFKPGFSTARTVTEIAGRGVGLDVVQNHLARMRGTITIDSRPHQGTTFTIRLPLTLSIVRVIVCKHQQSLIGIPLDSVEETLELPVVGRGDRCFIQWRNREVPFVPLTDLLPYYRGTEADAHLPESGSVSTAVLRSGDAYIAVSVNGFQSEQEVVIKQLRGPVPRPTGIAGATVLGDGTVLPILDVGELIGLLGGQRLLSWTPTRTPETASTAGQKTILIVDDSITVRELLSSTFSKAGYRVEQARDGQEAIDRLRQGLKCNAIFCDVEMPRMDGFEFLSQIQHEPHLSALPIAMLTSRSAEKHRQTAFQLGAMGYFTKPYLEDELVQGARRLLAGEQVEARSF